MTVTQRETEPRQLLDWEDTLWVELVFECAGCEWSQVVARYPTGCCFSRWEAVQA